MNWPYPLQAARTSFPFMLIEMLKGAGGGEWLRGTFREITSFVSLSHFTRYSTCVGSIRPSRGEWEECLLGLVVFTESWEMGVFSCWLDSEDCWEFIGEGSCFFTLVLWHCVNCASKSSAMEVARSGLDEFNSADKSVSFRWSVTNFWRSLGRPASEEPPDWIDDAKDVPVSPWDGVALSGMLTWGNSPDDVMGVGRGRPLSMSADLWPGSAKRCWWTFIWYCWYFIIWWCRACSCCLWLGFRLACQNKTNHQFNRPLWADICHQKSVGGRILPHSAVGVVGAEAAGGLGREERAAPGAQRRAAREW